MATGTTPRPALDGEELQKLLELIEGRRQRRAEGDGRPSRTSARPCDALGLDPLQAQIRQVFFFDTPDLALDKQGVVVRAPAIAEARATTR